MSRVRTDPLVAALTHPTRQGAYQALSQCDEMSTVQIQGVLNVDRYNLYHHLKRLVKVGLIVNHRDVGRDETPSLPRWTRGDGNGEILAPSNELVRSLGNRDRPGDLRISQLAPDSLPKCDAGPWPVCGPDQLSFFR